MSADRTLLGACKKMTWQQIYNAKYTCINHFTSEKFSKTSLKHDVVEEPPEMTVDDFMSVSKLSIKLHVVKLQLHYLFFT